MADTKISSLASSAAQLTDLLPVARAGANYGVTVASILAALAYPAHSFIFGSKDVSLSYATVGGASRGNANEVGVARLILKESITITSVSVFVVTASGTGNDFVGIYSFDGNTKIVDSGPLDGHSASQVIRSLSFPAITIPPGSYWFVWGSDQASAGSLYGKAAAVAYNALANGISTSFGRAANPIAGGVLPATLGTITPYAYGDSVCNVIEAMFQ